MLELSKNAVDLLNKRYLHPGESIEGLFRRISKAIAIKDDKFEKELYELMTTGTFLPNSPCIRNAGKKRGLLSACFVLPIEDSMNSIFETIKNTAMIFKGGGGCGINFSPLRPKDSPLSGGGTSSGVLSFMNIFDAITQTIKQGGYRRGALMGVLYPDHPEILNFCRTKLHRNLTNFNLSIMVRDDFMKKAVSKKDGIIKLIHDDKLYGTARAKDILDLVALSSWICGDPGILFYDRINKDNKGVVLEAVNPCQPKGSLLLDGELLRPIEAIYGDNWESWKKTNKEEVLELTCNNGLILKFTPSHKLMLEDGTWIEAKDSIGKSLKWGLGNRIGGVDNWYELLGFLFGDGFKCGCGFGVSIKLNPEKEPEVASMLLQNGFHRQNSGAFYCNIKTFGDQIDFINFPLPNRILPDEFLYSDSIQSSSFLRGLFEANGSVNGHGQISLKATNLETIRKVQIMLASFGMPSWYIKNKPTAVEWKNGVYISKESYNLQIAPRVGQLFKEKIGFLSNRKSDKIKVFNGNYNSKLKVISIRSLGEMEVWDYSREDPPNYNFCQGVIAANCGESPLPPYGACTLGSVNVSKFIENSNFNVERFYDVIKSATRALLHMNIIGHYPLTAIGKTMQDLNPIGVGLMAFADALIMLGIKYDSQDCLDFIDLLSKPYVEATEDVAKDSFYKRVIAPTGSLSILADCSPSIEPIFARAFQRNITTGTILETRNLYSSEYVRTAHEVSPEWHLKIQAKFQSILDGACSKTINLPAEASVEDVKNVYINAWKMGCKGITIFRDSSIEGVFVPVGKCEGELCSL